MTQKIMPEDDSSLSPPSSTLLRKLYHSVNDAIFIQDAETGEILDVNGAMCEMYGYTRIEARQLSVEDLSSGKQPYTQENALEYVQKAANGEPQVFDWQAKDSDGEVFWVEVSMRQTDVDGVSLILVIVRDISERKGYEKELKETSEGLQALNSIVRHDIRNDVGVILGWAQLLEDHVDEGGKEYLQNILASGENIVELTETAENYIEVLTESGGLEVEPIPLRSILETELELRRESFPHAEFILLGEVPDIEVMANKMLGSVFRNILNNAVQHNDQGPSVTLSCEVGVEDVTVRIADNGPGIPDDVAGSVFKKGEKDAESSGSGLGLHLAQTLTDQFGGSVEAADNSPRGTVMAVCLPKSV